MAESISSRKSVWQRQIPTLFGLIFLVVALGVGVFFFGTGGLGVFAPRATPQTTPKNIKITNITDSTFSVSFLTDETTTGFVKYGTTEGDLENQSSDDRDQLSGSVGDYSTHHITVRSLQPNTTYYFTLGTGSGSDFNNEGVPFSVKTGPLSNETGTAQTIYGNVTTSDGRPADGAIVYVESPEMGEMSTLVKSSGSWAIALATARSADGQSLASLSETSSLGLLVQGALAREVSRLNVTVAEAQPVPSITLGSNSVNPTASPTSSDTSTSPSLTDFSTTPTATLSADLPPVEEIAAVPGQLEGLLDDQVASTSANVTVDLTNETPQTVSTSQPIISGTAAPNVLVTIEVHSENQISQQVVTDANGNFVLDTSLLAANLEPGEHTATYSYVDPNTGQTVTKTQTFYVASPNGSSNTLLAQANTNTGTENQTGGPFSSGNPFPIPDPSPSPVATRSATPSASPVSTRSATTSSRPSTQSGVPVSGSTGTTIALLLGGFFFIFAGVWSYWVAMQVKESQNE